MYCILVVTRIEAKSETCEMFMHLDVNSEVYPMKEGEKFSMALTSTINLDGTPDTGYFTPVNLNFYLQFNIAYSTFLFVCTALNFSPSLLERCSMYELSSICSLGL